MGTPGAKRFASLGREALSGNLILYSHLLADGVTKHGMERSGPERVREVLPLLDNLCRDHHVIEVEMTNNLAGLVLAKNTTEGVSSGEEWRYRGQESQ